MTLVPVVLATLALAQLPPSPDPKPVAVTGIAVDGAGQPVAFVDVWLAEAMRSDQGRRFGVELFYSHLTSPDEGSTPVSDHLSTDATGRFTFRIPAEAVARRSPPALAVWAASTGAEARLGWQRLPSIILADDPPVRVVLGAPAKTELTILSPDRKPVAGARVTPTHAGELPIRKRLTFALETTTDAAGRAVLACLTPEVLGAVRVETQSFGTQDIEIPDSRFPIPDTNIQKTPGGSITLTLAPVGRIAGKLVATTHEPIRGVTVRATTQVGGYAGSAYRGSTTVACDPQGRFEIPAIAAGMLDLELEFDPVKSPPLRGQAPKHVVLKAGRTTEITIPLRETILVRGLLREKGTNRPIVGAKAILNSYYGGDRFAISDAAGRYAGRILREVNQPYGWPIRVPAPFFIPADFAYPRQNMPQRGVGELELTPLVLARGVDVQGTVAGEDNQPVAGAEVEAIWTTEPTGSQGSLARTDRSGGFTFHGIDPIAELSLAARDGFASMPAVIVRPDDAAARPIRLTISPKHTTPVGGRVVDPTGQPIAGASVRITRQVRDQAGRVILVDPIAGEDGSLTLHTDAEGRYRIPQRLPAHHEYYAEASAPGRLTARSPAIALTEPSRKLPVLVLRRLRTVEGRVIDRQGQPVAGARVRQSGDGPMPTETLTTNDGRFRLPGVLEGPALVLAEKAGFRVRFQPIGNEPKPVEVVLARTSEPPAVAYHTLPPALPVEEEKALARRLIQPYVANVLARGKEYEKFRLFVEPVEVDPLAAIDWLESIKFADADLGGMARVRLADALAREDLEEATELLEASDSADVRAQGYVGICDVRRDLNPDRRKELLIQAGVNAKSMKVPADRILVEARIAEHWLDLGETERARTFINEALALGRNTTKGIKVGGYNLGQVAEALARLDLPAGLKVLDEAEREIRTVDRSDRSAFFDRCRGHIAYQLAARAPADAEKVLERIPIKRTPGDRFVTAVCSRMAAKDLARARRIAATRISTEAPECRPHVFGLMARSIAATDKTTAIKLIDEAYSALDQIAANGETAAYPVPVEVAAGLLPIVEQIEPDRLAEFLARTLALRPAQGDPTGHEGNATASSTAALAIMIARYDRALAARLLEPELRNTGSHVMSFGTDDTAFRVLAALAVIDPKRAVEQVEALPDDPAPGTEPWATKNRVRVFVARALAFHGADRWRYFYEEFLYLWTPDHRFL